MKNSSANNYKYTCRYLILVLVFVLHSLYSNAQIRSPLINADSISQKIDFYNTKKSNAVLFVHLDKNIYTNNENVWFTAYLFKCNNISQHNTLSVALIKDDDHTIAMEAKFVMGQGLAFGNLFLPDTIAPGNYSFIAYTNRLVQGKPEVRFTQEITIKTITEESFSAAIAFADTSKQTGPNKRVLVTVKDKNNIPLIGVNVDYKLIGIKKPGVIAKETDIAGNAELDVSAEYHSIEADIKYNKVVKHVKLILPSSQKLLSVKFYPEGGNLVNDIKQVVGWEIRSAAGNPMQCSGILYKNNTPIDTIYTNASGMGRFVLKPETGLAYSVKLSNDPTIGYTLPQAMPNGTAVTITKALNKDTLMVKLTGTQKGKVYLMVHNGNELFYLTPIQLMPFVSRTVKVDLVPIPRGVTKITVLDSLQRPIAERLFFAGYDKKPQLNLITDKSEYATRQKVTLKLKLDSTAQPLKGLVSIACVQSSRIDQKKFTNIESYFYLNNELDLAGTEGYKLELNNDNRSYLEDVLLIKGWSRYTWADLIKSKATDTLLDRQSVSFTGVVIKSGKPVKEPQAVGLLQDTTTRIISTNASGNFVIDLDHMITVEDKKIMFFANNTKDYAVNIVNPYNQLNKQLATDLTTYYPVSGIEQNTALYYMKGMEHTIQLKEVKMTDGKSNNAFGYIPGIRLSPCTDWVCMNNVLNCPNHPSGSSPVDGGTYTYNGRPFVYHGECKPAPNINKTLVKVDGVWTSKEFYVSDYEKYKPPGPEYPSTVYWKSLINISSEKETEVSFYTNDLTGDFKIIAQGLTTDGVIYSNKSFKVKKP